MKNPDKEDLMRTPIFDIHVELGATMVPFAGWSMPVRYESVIKEHNFVREDAGIFDICHMGEFELKGPQTFDFIQKMVTNDLNLLEKGKSQYACMCYPNGTVVDDLIYYMVEKDYFIMIVNGANVEKDFQWLNSISKDFDVEIIDCSKDKARFAFQGPKSQEKLQTLLQKDLNCLKRFYFMDDILKFAENSVNGDECQVFIARTGYTGENGYEISFEKKYAGDVFKSLLKTGAKPIGLGARDSLRLEMAYSLYGHEISEKITPVEGSIGWVVKDKDEIDYFGKEILLSQKKEGPKRKIVGLNLVDKGIMREDYKVIKNDKEIGYITSGGLSPTLEKSIALALINTEEAIIGSEVEIQIRKQLKKAVIVKTPFIQK